jgi:hypothetical protein
MARGRALEFLRAWMDRERPTLMSSEPAYMVDDLLLTLMARHGYPMMRQELNGSVMTYLKDAGLAEYRMSQPAGPRGPSLLAWRITHDGLAVLEGTQTDPGIQVP